VGEPERSKNWCELEEVKCSKKRATIKAKGHFNTCTDARTTSEMHLIGSTFCVLLIVFLFFFENLNMQLTQQLGAEKNFSKNN